MLLGTCIFCVYKYFLYNHFGRTPLLPRPVVSGSTAPHSGDAIVAVQPSSGGLHHQPPRTTSTITAGTAVHHAHRLLLSVESITRRAHTHTHTPAPRPCAPGVVLCVNHWSHARIDTKLSGGTVCTNFPSSSLPPSLPPSSSFPF